MIPLAFQAPAKLNLALSVGPRAADTGMHPICSWMTTINLYDDLLLSRLDHDRLSRYAILWHKDARRRSEINWSITRDLAVRAHLALEKHVGRALPVQLKLEKRIPVGSGLGGGSSDAAAMLRALNELFQLNLSWDELASVGSTIGSDVPFLVRGGSAIVEGLGEKITALDPPALDAVIVFPDATCSTAQVYQFFDEMGEAELDEQRVRRLAQSGGRPDTDAMFNDLRAAAIRAAPPLEDCLASLSTLAEKPAHITGSGSAIFVLCDNALHAEALARSVEQRLNLPAVAVQSTIAL